MPRFESFKVRRYMSAQPDVPERYEFLYTRRYDPFQKRWISVWRDEWEDGTAYPLETAQRIRDAIRQESRDPAVVSHAIVPCQ